MPQEDAVEAETLAQFLDEDATDLVQQVKLTYPVHDTDRLMERLLSDRRAGRMPVDPKELADENQPPPRRASTCWTGPSRNRVSTCRRTRFPRCSARCCIRRGDEP